MNLVPWDFDDGRQERGYEDGVLEHSHINVMGRDKLLGTEQNEAE